MTPSTSNRFFPWPWEHSPEEFLLFLPHIPVTTEEERASLHRLEFETKYQARALIGPALVWDTALDRSLWPGAAIDLA